MSFLNKLDGPARSILYVVDLPLEQHAAQKIEIPTTGQILESEIFKNFDIICVYNDKMKNTIARKCGISERDS